MGAKKGGPPQEAVDELVKRYLVDKIRVHAGADQELFDNLLDLHDLVIEREAGADSTTRLHELRDSPMVRAALAFLGERFQRLADVGIRLAHDTQALRRNLGPSLAALGIDPADPAQLTAAEAEYERVLVDTVPLETALVPRVTVSVLFARRHT